MLFLKSLLEYTVDSFKLLAQPSWLSIGAVRKHLQEFLLPSFEMGLLPSKHGEVMKGFLYTGIYCMSRDLMRIKLECLSEVG